MAIFIAELVLLIKLAFIRSTVTLLLASSPPSSIMPPVFPIKLPLILPIFDMFTNIVKAVPVLVLFIKSPLMEDIEPNSVKIALPWARLLVALLPTKLPFILPIVPRLYIAAPRA